MEEHWSTRVRERALWRDSAGRLPVELSGGSDTGHFTWIRPLTSAAHRDILLELEALPVSGLPLGDVLNLLNNCGDPIRIKTVKAGGRLKKGLSYFLSQRFQKHSADHQLQESVRINLHRHTAPSLRPLPDGPYISPLKEMITGRCFRMVSSSLQFRIDVVFSDEPYFDVLMRLDSSILCPAMIETSIMT